MSGSTFIGPGAEQINLEGVIYPHFKGGLNQIAEYGEQLPAGLVITMPDINLPETDNLIRLWD